MSNSKLDLSPHLHSKHENKSSSHKNAIAKYIKLQKHVIIIRQFFAFTSPHFFSQKNVKLSNKRNRNEI